MILGQQTIALAEAAYPIGTVGHRWGGLDRKLNAFHLLDAFLLECFVAYVNQE
jgi:hypothetical protein